MTGKDMVKLLEQHGWQTARITGSHHILKKGGHIIPVPVHGKRDLATGTEKAILKLAGLNQGPR